MSTPNRFSPHDWLDDVIANAIRAKYDTSMALDKIRDLSEFPTTSAWRDDWLETMDELQVQARQLAAAGNTLLDLAQELETRVDEHLEKERDEDDA